MNQKEFRVKLEGDKVILTIIETQQTVSSVELDKEDLIELTGDLNNYVGKLSNKEYRHLPKLNLGPSFKGISKNKLKEAKPMLQDKGIDTTGWSKDKLEAYEQSQRKLKLEAEMRRMFVDVLDDEYLETKFATVYKLDEINREVEILAKKLNKL